MDKSRGRKAGPTTTRFSRKRESSGISCKLLIEIIFFLFWMLFTGFAGYLVGYSSNPDPKASEPQTKGMVQLTTDRKSVV